MLAQEYDLPSVLRIVRDLTVDRLHHRMWLVADRDGAHHILGLERLDGGKDAIPSFFPPLHHIRASGSWAQLKFAVAKTVGLFAIGGEEVGEARAHIAREVFDQD